MTLQDISQTSANGYTSLQMSDYDALIEQGMQLIEENMLDITNSDVTVLRDASRHILGSGGKRIRPRMVVLSYLACGGHDLAKLAPLGSAVELVHTASVVHDDINDHGVVRRGKPSVNAIWGRTFALLTGDFLFTKVYELMAPFKDLNIYLAEATVALVEGETLQAVSVKENNLNREIYNRIIALKTAALFKAGARIGASFANAPKNIVEALGEYGFNIGMAFQVVDDILDLTADSEQLGKTAGIDVEQGRGIGVVIASEKGADTAHDPMEKVKKKLLEGGAIEEGRRYAQLLVEMAINALEPLPESPIKQQLVNLANKVIDRKY